ncbi:MAG TPA: TonB-dependent receptor plug domain-containing protein [Candidatus Competibacter sp.]|nr:TonB-dependent receptor plug domain-containing protein [Candidatus Competibacter sp.]
MATAQDTAPDLTHLSIEELMNVEIFSVARKTQKLFDTPAAAFVITREDIDHSGATSIPDLLRMVPGVAVAQYSVN